MILSSLWRLDKQKGQIHTYYTCKEKDCHCLSDPSGGTFSKAPTASGSCSHKFQHGWLFQRSENHDVYEPSTGVWWLAFHENVGMFYLLSRLHDTCTKRNKDYTWNTKPCVKMITQASQLHFNSDIHRSAIEKEHLKQISPFQKEHESRKQCENEVLNKVFMSIYWLAQEEISNTKLLSLFTWWNEQVYKVSTILHILGKVHCKKCFSFSGKLCPWAEK